MNNTLSTQLEIDLIQVIKDLLLQWKAILAVMLIFGIATPSAMYVKDMRSYNATVAANEELKAKVAASRDEGAETEETDIFAGLEEADKAAVEGALFTKKNLESAKRYVEESPLMKLDALALDQMVLEYYLDTPDGSDFAAVGNAYLSSFYDKDFTDEVAGALGTTPEYVNELVYVGNTEWTFSAIDVNKEIFKKGYTSGLATGDMLIVTVYLPEGADAAKTESKIKDHITKTGGIISSDIGEHDLKLISVENRSTADRDLEEKQLTKRSNLMTLESNLKSAETALSDSQMQVYSAASAPEVEEETAAPKPESVEPVKPGFSKKYAAIGLMLGLVLYGGIYLLLLIFVPVIRTGLELSDMLGIKSFGCFHSDPKRFGFFCDKLVYRLLYHKEKSADELMEDGAERIAVYAKYHELSEVTLISADADSKAAIEALLAKLTAKGITSSYVDLWDGEKLTDRAEESMSGKDNYVICMMPRATLVKDVDKMLSVSAEYQKKVIGTVAI